MHSSAGRYGADRQLELIATGLDPARFRAVVALPHDGPLAERLREHDISVHVRPLAVLRRELLSARGLAGLGRALRDDAVQLPRLARACGAQLIHSNTSVCLGGAAAARRAGLPHVWHVREIYEGFGPLWRAHRRLLAGSQAAVCVSEAVRARLGPGAQRARVLHDGLAVQVAGVRAARRASARAQLGLGPSDAALVVLGRLSEWKGQQVLVRALAEPALSTAATGPRALAVLAGDAWAGDLRPARELSELAGRLGVGDRVRLLGFEEDVGALYAAADVVVVPSTRPDPLPNSALEAAAAGCCLVASDLGGLREIVRDGHTGVLVAPGDPARLAGVLAGLIAEPSRRELLGGAAARDVAERFSPEKMLSGVEAIYGELIAAGS